MIDYEFMHRMRPKARSANGELQELTAISVARARYLAFRPGVEAELAASWREQADKRKLVELLRTVKALRASVPDWQVPVSVAELIARSG